MTVVDNVRVRREIEKKDETSVGAIRTGKEKVEPYCMRIGRIGEEHDCKLMIEELLWSYWDKVNYLKPSSEQKNVIPTAGYKMEECTRNGVGIQLLLNIQTRAIVCL